MDSLSFWDILGLAILVGPLALAFSSLMAWFLYAAYEDFITKKSRNSLNYNAKAPQITIRTGQPPTMPAVHETVCINNADITQPTSQIERFIKTNKDTKEVVQELLLLFIKQSKQSRQ